MITEETVMLPVGWSYWYFAFVSEEVKLLLPITVCKRGYYTKKLGIFRTSYVTHPYRCRRMVELSISVNFPLLLFFILYSLSFTVSSLFWDLGRKVCLVSNVSCFIYINSCNVNSNYWSESHGRILD
jgi:hypothetical protein